MLTLEKSQIGPSSGLYSGVVSLRIRIDGHRILDVDGRELLLRGINAGGRAKFPPYAPFAFHESGLAAQQDAPSFDDALNAYADRLQRWGMSVVRLPFSWEALEPERGRYDDAYLQRYEKMVLAYAARGMRVIVDFHQDVFARPYAGDGFPLWACPTPEDGSLSPAPANPHWFMGYVQDDRVKQAFDRFWADDDGLLAAFEAMWHHMAARMWQHDAVIGFEVINEPGWGTAGMHEWAAQTLTPFYSHMARVIREVAPDAPIFFDATGADALSCTTGLARPDGEGFVFAPHFYAPEVILEGRWEGDVKSIRPLRRWAELGREWNVPVLLGEFGVTPRAQGCDRYVRANYDALDEHRMHATLWECSTTEDDWNDEGMSVLGPGGSEGPTVAELVRPYPLAVAGQLTSFRFDAERNEGELRYVARAGGLTEIVLPERRFPSCQALFEQGSGTFEQIGDRGHIRATNDGAVTLRIRVDG